VGLCIFGWPAQKYIGPPIKRVKLLKHRPCGPVSQKVKHENCDSHDITEILLKVALNTITLVILLQTIA
jgi:hypothetical protein